MLVTKVSLLSLATNLLAAPTKRQDAAINSTLQNLTYTVMALRSGSPVHLLPLNAIAGRFYLGGQTTSYCPEEISWGNFCPPGNITVFKDSCSLDAQNPEYWNVSEQTLWNTDDGIIGYDFSQPRPAGTLNCPWYLGTSENTAFAATIEATYGADGFLACPTGDAEVWQVLRSVTDETILAPPLGEASACLGVDLVALKYDSTEYGAWVYT